MRNLCPRCGNRLNPVRRGYSIHEPRAPGWEQGYGDAWSCDTCGAWTKNPVHTYDGRLEWFFSWLMPRVLAYLGIVFILMFVLSVLGICD